MNEKLEIELTPYEALNLLRFLTEFEPQLKEKQPFHSLYCAFKSFEKEVYKKVSVDDVNQAWAERIVNQEFGFEPD